MTGAQVGGLEGLTACPLSPRSHADVCAGKEGKGAGCCPHAAGRQGGEGGAAKASWLRGGSASTKGCTKVRAQGGRKGKGTGSRASVYVKNDLIHLRYDTGLPLHATWPRSPPLPCTPSSPACQHTGNAHLPTPSLCTPLACLHVKDCTCAHFSVFSVSLHLPYLV